MSDTTTIEWTHRPGTKGCTWNPIRARNKLVHARQVYGVRGWHCEHVSEACRNCYAERINAKEGATGGTGLLYKPAHLDGGGIEVYLDEQTLMQPLKWRSPRTIFVCSMTDIFGRWVKDEWIDRIFAVSALCPHHTFIMLTKRPERMYGHVSAISMTKLAAACVPGSLPITQHDVERALGLIPKFSYDPPTPALPLQNVWLGVTAEDQPNADARIPHLLATPAAVRFVSCEPMLGPIDLYNGDPDPRLCGHQAKHTFIGDWWEPGDNMKGPSRHGLDWVICGGESGKNARPTHPDWVRSLRDQCAAAGVPFFFKQWGEWNVCPNAGKPAHAAVAVDGSWAMGEEAWGIAESYPDHVRMIRVGKKDSGRLLDGVEHNEWPEARVG